MQQYINKMVDIRKNISAYFKTLTGGENIFKKMAKEFIPGYAQVVEARNYQLEASILFSCNFKGSKEQEKIKRKSYTIKKEQYPIVKKFVKKISFEKALNFEEIVNQFYNANLNCCRINLDDILKDEIKYFRPPHQDKVQHLNDEMEKLSLFLFEYFKSLYSKEGIIEEYIISFQEIQQFVYKIIRKRAKNISNIFKSIDDKLNKYLEENKQYFPVRYLLSQIQDSFLGYQEMKIYIESMYQDIMSKFRSYLKKQFTFEVTQILQFKYIQQLTEDFLEQIMISLKSYWDFEKHPAFPVLKQKLEFLFHQYLSENKFIGGIVDKQINQQLQLLIYSVDWIQECDAASAAMELLQEISKFHINLYQTESQVLTKEKDFSIEILNEFKQNNLQKCQKAQDWWNTNIKQETNILIIFQIYVILAQFQLNNPIGEYTPNRKNALIQILRVLNNGYYNYLNVQILQICENITHQIEIQILQTLQNNQNQSKKKEQQKEIDFQIGEYPIKILNNEIIQQFSKSKELFLSITSSKGQTNKAYQTIPLLKKIEIIKDFRKAELKVTPPSKIEFVVLSKPNNHSNVITLLISGFRTSKEDRLKYWQSHFMAQSGTVVALTWKSNKFTENGKQLAEKFYPILQEGVVTPQSIFKMAKFIKDLNPYDYSCEEAQRLGRYLAFLIADHNLFGGYQLNIVAYSLGTLVVLECIKMLDEIYEINQKQYINSIMLLGGVADTRKLQKRRWNSVGGQIHNVYSKNDCILSYIVKVNRIYEKPCGLSKIYLGYKQVLNYNYTNIVKGHDDYRKILGTILVQTDFSNDFKYLTSEIKY